MTATILIIIGTVLLVLGLRAFACWLIFRDRKVEQIEDLYKLFQFKIPIDIHTFTKLITLIGKCYHVIPGKLRPSDSFDGRLGKLDTWNLGCGAEELQRRLENEHLIQLRADIRIETIQQLFDYCAAVSGKDGKGSPNRGSGQTQCSFKPF